MKQGFLTKAFVAVGVMVSALALSSVCAFAATEYTTLNFTKNNSYNQAYDSDAEIVDDNYITVKAAAKLNKSDAGAQFGDTATTISKLKNGDTVLPDLTSVRKYFVFTPKCAGKVVINFQSGNKKFCVADITDSDSENWTTVTYLSGTYDTIDAVVEANKNYLFFIDAGSQKVSTFVFKENSTTPSIKIDSDDISLYVGESDTLSTVTENIGDNSVEWSSSDSNVAEINQDGKVTAKGTGTAVITAKVTVDGIDYEDTINVTSTVDTTSRATESFSIAFKENTTKGQDLGNGVFTVDALNYSDESGVFDKYSGGITNSTNPEDSTGTTGSSITYPVKGAALMFKTNTAGKCNVYLKTSSSKSIYVKKLDSSDVLTEVYKETVDGAKNVSFSVDENCTYYIFGQGTKAKFFGLDFSKSTPLSKVDDKAAIISYDGTYYAVGVVSQNNVEDITKLKVNDFETNTVYSSVTVGDTEYTAADLGGVEGDYLYGVKVNINASGESYTASAVQNMVTVSTEVANS